MSGSRSIRKAAPLRRSRWPPKASPADNRGVTAWLYGWMPRWCCQDARPPWPMEDGRPRLLVRMRSWQACVTGDTWPSHCAAPLIRRGCRVHAVQTTWLWHPCRMVWYVRCQSGPELPSCPRAVPTLISGSGPIVIQGEREHRVSRRAGGARQGVDAGWRGCRGRGARRPGSGLALARMPGRGLALTAAMFGAHGQLGSSAG